MCGVGNAEQRQRHARPAGQLTGRVGQPTRTDATRRSGRRSVETACRRSYSDRKQPARLRRQSRKSRSQRTRSLPTRPPDHSATLLGTHDPRWFGPVPTATDQRPAQFVDIAFVDRHVFRHESRYGHIDPGARFRRLGDTMTGESRSNDLAASSWPRVIEVHSYPVAFPVNYVVKEVAAAVSSFAPPRLCDRSCRGLASLEVDSIDPGRRASSVTVLGARPALVGRPPIKSDLSTDGSSLAEVAARIAERPRHR